MRLLSQAELEARFPQIHDFIADVKARFKVDVMIYATYLDDDTIAFHFDASADADADIDRFGEYMDAIAQSQKGLVDYRRDDSDRPIH